MFSVAQEHGGLQGSNSVQRHTRHFIRPQSDRIQARSHLKNATIEQWKKKPLRSGSTAETDGEAGATTREGTRAPTAAHADS